MRSNCFDFLRFVFALLVVISHSYPLSGNSVSQQFIYQLTDGQIELSNIGLNGFFILSGYLIFHSLKRSKNVFEYYWKRFLRLFPALIVVLLVTLFLAPFVYENNVPYMKNKEVFSYFFDNVTLYNIKYSIEGIFTNNIYPKAINGSLWTLCYEFTMYLLLSILFLFRRNEKLIKVLIGIAFIVMLIGRFVLLSRFGNRVIFELHLTHFFNLGTYFVFGSFLAIYNLEKLQKKNNILILVILVILVSLYFSFYKYVMYICLPILILLIGLKNIPKVKNFGKYGDASYGIYIYSFPIQQTLMYYFNLSTLVLMVLSIIIAIFFGYLSWHLVEKKFLLLKNYKPFLLK